MESISVYNLNTASSLSEVRCADFSEAASVCLDFHRHKSGKVMEVVGDLVGQFELVWGEVTQKMIDSRADMDYTVESGAYCLAMLVVERMLGLRVVKQSKKMTGFDYWLEQLPDVGFQGQARLEVSGILSGTKSQIRSRLKAKLHQTKRSDQLSIPAYVVIVEFSQPSLTIKKR